jgi:endonuclease/exonuclease/phosphatase family metal-dependent hydrolase
MKRWTLSLLATAVLATGSTASAADIEVMTQNQYVGTDLIGLVTAPDFNVAVADALRQRAATLPAERARALAALIARRAPALVGLQEVYRFDCLEFPAVADGKGCDNPAIAGAFTDQLEDTLAALGGAYYAAATVVDIDLPAGLTLPDGSPLPLPEPLPGIPVQFDDMTIWLRVVDRDVILARRDVATGVVPYNAICPLPAADGCNFQAVASAVISVEVPGVGAVPVLVKFQRGFVGVNASVGGVPYRFVNTHLETRLEGYGEPGRYFQSAQAAELLQFMLVYLPPEPGRRLLLTGDMNSDPRDETFPSVLPGYPPIVAVPPYQQFTALAGLTDIWTRRPGASTGQGAPLVGFSCCQAEDLLNRRSGLYERVDLIFSLQSKIKVQDARLLGESVADKTPPAGRGLWPSDHASVGARISD